MTKSNPRSPSIAIQGLTLFVGPATCVGLAGVTENVSHNGAPKATKAKPSHPPALGKPSCPVQRPQREVVGATPEAASPASVPRWHSVDSIGVRKGQLNCPEPDPTEARSCMIQMLTVSGH